MANVKCRCGLPYLAQVKLLGHGHECANDRIFRRGKSRVCLGLVVVQGVIVAIPGAVEGTTAGIARVFEPCKIAPRTVEGLIERVSLVEPFGECKHLECGPWLHAA